MHLIIYFNGTGDNGDSLASNEKEGFHYKNPHKVKTLIVEGCHHRDVCNAIVFPNLADFAKRFVAKLFAHIKGEFKLRSVNFAALKIGINIESDHHSPFDNNHDPITAITLCGYSRGAVTCFNVAKELYKIAPTIPVNIVANQPVPGNIYQYPGSNAAAVADCSYLTNLRQVSIILGSYTGEKAESSPPRWVHRLGYSQIVPKLPNSHKCTREIELIHRRNHIQKTLPSHEFSGTEHLHHAVAKILDAEQSLHNNVMPDLNLNPTSCIRLPAQNQLQTFFGLKRSAAYQYIDPAIKRPHLCEGTKKRPSDSYETWWQQQDKYASFFSSDLTKQLVQQIKMADQKPGDKNALKTLYQHTEHWLAIKNGTKTSRYYQVTALRDNIYYQLIQLQVTPEELFNDYYENMHKGRYLLRQWQTLSALASCRKSWETKSLDRAFESHFKEKNPSVQSDKQLLIALERWLENKEGGTSKRYELVRHFRDRIKIMKEQRYPESKRMVLRDSQ